MIMGQVSSGFLPIVRRPGPPGLEAHGERTIE